MDETNTVETVEDNTTASNVMNFVVLGFAVIGAVQTTKFVLTKAREGYHLIRTAQALKTPATEE